MRNFDFTPLFRSSIGFDRVFDLLDQAVDVEADSAYPPYNIEKSAEDSYRLTMVVPGFKPEELSVISEGATLTVTGENLHDGSEKFLYRGFADRSFKRTFRLAEYMKVVNAQLENGLLWISLKQEIPEAMKPRKINVIAPAAKPVTFSAVA